jgi:DNA-directed RNA polymerase subunit RPC12/RpoP
MPASLDCPGIECWQALLGDAVPASERDTYERHLESCPTCQQRLHQAEECGDDLRRWARRAGDPTTAPEDPALARVLDRLRGSKSLLRPAPVEAADLYFLQPSERPGVLGMLGEYEVQEVIGQGGFGIVLKAYEPALHRLVAIKVLSPALAGSANARRRFSREAQVAAAVTIKAPAPADPKVLPEPAPQLVSLACPGCKAKVRARASSAGKKVKCPQCGKAILVPASDALRAGIPPS